VRRHPNITGGGTGIVHHLGARLPAEVADELGLSALSAAMAPTTQRRRGHDH
jgi:hypothetical protein